MTRRRSSPGPGWYPDPAERRAWRWWDGRRWVPATRPPGHPPASPPGRRTRWTAAVAGPGAVVSLGLAAGCAAAGHAPTSVQSCPYPASPLIGVAAAALTAGVVLAVPALRCLGRIARSAPPQPWRAAAPVGIVAVIGALLVAGVSFLFAYLSYVCIPF